MRVITIGRSSENNVVINDAKVSRTHLQLVQNDNGTCSVVDLNSANGTFVNGQKITGEVPLQPQDVIRIGDTTLPWQEYVNSLSSVAPKPMDIARPAPKTHRTWWYVAACVVFVLLAGGVGLYFYNKKEQKEIAAKQIEENIQREQLRQEAEQRAEKAERLQDEADELLRQALISQSDESMALAEAKQKEATEAMEQAEAALQKAETAQRDAEKANEKAQEEANRAAAAEQDAAKARQDAANAEEAASKANAERDAAREEARLTGRFYEEYAVMKPDFARQVFVQLKRELPQDKNDAKKALKDLFDQSNNKDKQAIVDAIQVVRQQNSRTKTSEPEIKPDSVVSAKDSAPVDDEMPEKSDE